jgi:hypothetical protein
MYDNYDTIDRKLCDLKRFEGRSLTAHWVQVSGAADQWEYMVKSYAACIATVLVNGNPNHPGAQVEILSAWITDSKYSVTTTKHVNRVQRWLGKNKGVVL